MSQSSGSLNPAERKALAEYAIQKSRQALQNGERRNARRYAEQAASLTPEREDPWLLLAAVASPRASVAYLKHALQINPSSHRALKGLDWAQRRLKKPQQIQSSELTPTLVDPIHQLQYAPPHRTITRLRVGSPRRQPAIPLFFIYAFGTLFLSIVFFAASLIPYYPNLYSDLSSAFENQPSVLLTVARYLSSNEIGYTKNPNSTVPANQIGLVLDNTQETTPPPVLLPTEVIISPSPTPTILPPDSPTPLPTQTPSPTDTPIPTNTPTYIPTTSPLPSLAPTSTTAAPLPTKKPKKKVVVSDGPGLRPGNVSLNDHWIDVDLSTQTTYAMQGDQVVRSFIVSTGRWPTVTITGIFKIYVKYRSANMSGDDYFLPNVPYVMYFFKGYGLHGTYWHNNFGTPMSHGCVNLRTNDASWLFSFASVGTIVNVHQ